MIHFLLLVSRQGKVRLSRWYSPCLLAGESSGSILPATAAAGRLGSSSFSAAATKSAAVSANSAAAAEASSAAATGFRRGGSAAGIAAAGEGGPAATAADGCSGRRGFHAAGKQKRAELLREAAAKVLQRNAKMSNVIEWREDTRLVYKRYASLFFIACIDSGDNPLLMLEVIHHFVEILDKYFGNVCELDLIFNFHKAYYLLDETVCAGELQESSKKVVLRVTNAQDALMEESHEKGGSKLT